jgi:hypothetical protein
MMKKLLCFMAIVLMATSAVALVATDFTGTWVGEFKMPSGDPIQLTYTFKQDGAAVTGTVAGPQGDPIVIEDGKVDGDKLLFNVTYNGATIKHEGTVTGDEMKLATKSDDPNFPGAEMTLKRMISAPAPAATPAPASTPAPPAPNPQ